MGRVLALIYGVVSYLIFLATFLYTIGFVGNLFVPKSIDSGRPSSITRALVIDTILLGLFAIQHSVMARPGFKRWWTKIVPQVIERSTYILLSSLLLALLFWQWEPVPVPVWHLRNPIGSLVLQVLFWAGWGMVLLSSFLINHFDLFGLRQVYLYQGRISETSAFKTPGLYKIIRHPIMLGFLIAFWATPQMTLGHLVFAVGTTAYILIALQFEERDLVNIHGKTYEEYRRRVSMLLPIPKRERLFY